MKHYILLLTFEFDIKRDNKITKMTLETSWLLPLLLLFDTFSASIKFSAILKCAMRHFAPLWPTLTYYESLWATMTHYEPLWPTMTHYAPLWVHIISQHFPPDIKRAKRWYFTKYWLFFVGFDVLQRKVTIFDKMTRLF